METEQKQRTRKRILVVATSRKTRGGITAVVKAHEQGPQWKKYNIKWIETHIDRNVFLKIMYFLFSFLQFLFLVPFYDLVHIHTSSASSVFRKLFYLIPAKLCRKKIVGHLHYSISSILYKRRNRLLYRCFFRACDVVLVLSNRGKQQVFDAVGIKDHVRVLYNPVVQLPPENMRNGAGRNYVLFAGTLNKQKGYHDLIRAFQKIAAAHPEWRLVFAGNGEIEEGRQLAESLGIASSVEFKGWVYDKEKELLFSEASVFCLPSYEECFPMAVLDAWAYGLPVVCTPVGGIPDVVVDGKNGLLFNPGDIDQLVILLDRIISDTHLRESLTKESHKLSESVFDLQHINGQLGDLYKEQLGE